MGKKDASGNTQLVAYIVPKTFSNEINQTVSIRKLRNYLKENIPEYMVPYSFVVLPAFPHTPSGKIDRRAIPAPEQLGIKEKLNYFKDRYRVSVYQQDLQGIRN